MTVVNTNFDRYSVSVVLQILFVASIGLATVTAISFGVLVWRFVFSSDARTPDLSFEWISSLSAERYAPMMRLTDEADFRFLRVQPGFTDDMEDRLRDHRYRMFMAYLRSLRSDFDGLATAMKYILANSDHDQANLASELLRAQVTFSWAFALAAVRAYAWRRGLCKVDVRELLSLFDSAQDVLRLAMPAQSAA